MCYRFKTRLSRISKIKVDRALQFLLVMALNVSMHISNILINSYGTSLDLVHQSKLQFIFGIYVIWAGLQIQTCCIYNMY